MKWTKLEEDFLIKNYSNLNLKFDYFEKYLNRNRDSIANKAKSLGVSRGYSFWKKEDENFLIKNYQNPKNSPSFFEENLNNKWSNIVAKANKLGLIRNLNLLTDSYSAEINDPNFIYECTYCKIPKPNSEYSKNKNQGRGRNYVTQCKKCRNEYSASEKVLKRKRELGPIQRNKYRLNSIFWASKQNAKKRNLEHNIELEYIKELFKTQKGLCYYTGKEMFIDTREKENNEDSVSLDRFDSSKGYIKGNVVLCRWIVNRMKNDIDFKDFLQIVSEINKKHNI